jgi:hypothetical protein
MIASRGMGDINPSKMPGRKVIHRKDKPNDVSLYAKGGEVWDKPRPKGLGKPKKLSSAKKAKAKAAAKAAGRPYPNLIDNMRAAK